MKAFIRAEKKLACDLRPGELFIVGMPDPDYFSRVMNGEDVAISVLVRTNVSDDDLEDKETVVHSLTIVLAGEGASQEPKIDPYMPPGFGKVR